MNPDRRLALLVVAIAFIVMMMASVYTAIREGVWDRLLAGVVIVLAISFGSAFIAIKLYTMYSQALTKACDSASVTQTPGGGLAVVHHPHVKVTVIQPPSRMIINAPESVPALVSPAPMEDVIRLLGATINHPDYGPKSTRVMTAADAQEIGLFPATRDWEKTVGYMVARLGAFTISDRGANNGTFLPSGKTVTTLLCDISVHDIPLLARG